MPRFVVIHGGVHQGKKHALAGSKDEDGKPADRVELSEAEAKGIDPSLKDGVGSVLILESKFAAQQAGEKARAEAIAKHEAAAAEAGEKAAAAARAGLEKPKDPPKK